MKVPHRIQSTFAWLRAFFLTYLWLGVALLLVAALIDQSYPEEHRSYVIAVLIKLIEGVGVSVLVASIFTYASETSEFVNKIRSLLEDIVVRRSFLASIDPDSKKEALKALIQPSESERNKYPNIGDYYGYFIERTLDVKNKSVRSNYTIEARAFYSDELKRVAMEQIYTYRLYPSSDGFIPITVGFEDKESFCSSVIVSDPNGKRDVHEKPQLKEHVEGGDTSYRATIDTKAFGDGKNHLDIELRVTEFGADHWKLLQFKALQPTDGFRFSLRCDGDLTVREHAIFVVGAAYYIDAPEDKKSIIFTCNQWINEGSGLCVLASRPEQ